MSEQKPEFYPTFRYHPVEAPAGRKFTDEAEFASLGPEWVDTPDKFPAAEIAVVAEPDGGVVLEEPKKRGRKAKETIQ